MVDPSDFDIQLSHGDTLLARRKMFFSMGRMRRVLVYMYIYIYIVDRFPDIDVCGDHIGFEHRENLIPLLLNCCYHGG
jgi:hypothetical protein